MDFPFSGNDKNAHLTNLRKFFNLLANKEGRGERDAHKFKDK